jgi:Circadian oscillating protein COP23
MMINKLAINSLTVSSLILASKFGLPEIVNAQQVKVAFFCGNYEGKPTTVAQAAQGDVPIIVWATEKGGGWTPQKRCEEVSKKFQDFYNQGMLNYLTTGIKNGQKVICGGPQKGSCQQILFTISDQSRDPDEVLQALFTTRVGATGGPITETMGSGQIYINLNEFLKNATPITAIPPEPTPNTGNIW